MNTLTTILLQDAAAASGGMSSIFMIVALIAVFYFFMIRPQNKERKKMREFINSLAVGDKVKTASGVYVVILEVSDNVKIKIDKNYIIAPAEPAQEAK